MKDYLVKMTSSAERAIEKINAVRKEDSLVIPVFTDLHTTDAGSEHLDKLLPALKLLTERVEYEAVIDLGDNFSMLGRNEHIRNEELKERAGRILSAVHETVKHPLITVNGNHDAIGTDFFKPDFWNSIVKGKYGNTMAVYSDEGSYYYIDYEKYNTRLIVLSLPHDSDLESDIPSPVWKFGRKQLRWLDETALNTTGDVIIISHVPFYYRYLGDAAEMLAVWDGEHEKMAYVTAVCGWIDDLDEAVEIISRHHKRPGMRLAGCLSGHMHRDSSWLPYEEKEGRKNPLPCHQLVTTAACFTSGMELEIGISIDVMVWTPSAGELHMIRIGDGEDRKIKV